MPKKLIFDINEIEKIDFKILMAYVHDNRFCYENINVSSLNFTH